MQQHRAHRPERAGAGAGHAVVEAQAEALGGLPFLLDRCVALQRRLGRAAEQQVQATTEDDHREHLVQGFGGQVVGDDGAGKGADKRTDDGMYPLARVKQLASVKGETGGGRAEGGAEFVGAQYQMGRHAGGEQGRGGEQAATAGDGVDEAGDERNDGQDGEGSEVYAEFEGHGQGLWLAGRYAKGGHLTCPMYANPNVGGRKPPPTFKRCRPGYLWVPSHSSAVRQMQIPRKYADISDHNPNVHGLVFG